ncbi:hypothetical protein ACHAXS_010547 [Conticribra weissflogii]
MSRRHIDETKDWFVVTIFLRPFCHILRACFNRCGLIIHRMKENKALHICT